MSVSYRIATEKDRRKYIDFINYVFSYDHCPHDFKTLLPKEYGNQTTGNATHFLALNEESEILGVVAVLPLSIHIADETLNCGYVGSVSVHPYARGNGHMKKLMAMAETWMRERNMDLAILSGQRQRYEYYGYSRGGMVSEYEVNASNIRHALKDIPADHVTFEEITDASDPRILSFVRLHENQPVYVTRGKEHFLSIANSWDNKLVAVTKNQACIGYLIATKECDIQEFVLNDSASYKPALKAWMYQMSKKTIRFYTHATDRAILEMLNKLAEGVIIKPSENFFVLDWIRTLPALLKLKQLCLGSLTDGVCHLTIDKTTLSLSCLDQNIKCEAISEKCKENISGFALQEMIFSVDALLHPISVGDAPMDWFPIPLSIPAPDQF